jgi:hypothetical protein
MTRDACGYDSGQDKIPTIEVDRKEAPTDGGKEALIVPGDAVGIGWSSSSLQ